MGGSIARFAAIRQSDRVHGRDTWQKGGVENANGRLRRWLPRHIDIDRLSDDEIQDIVITSNLTPRKCLDLKTPFRTILKELGKDVQIRFS
jgi:IS30 family transposase